MPSQSDLFDPAYTDSVGHEVIEPLIKYYFRLKVEGYENLPGPHEGRSLIFIANHAGRTFPWDAVLLAYTVNDHWQKEYDLPTRDLPRALSAPELSSHPRLFPFRLKNWWHRVGCVDATAINFARLLKQKQHIIVFPEGVPGIARDFKDRYQLLPFPTALCRLAQHHNARIVPISIVGSEYFHPYARRYPWLDRLGQRFGLPFLPLSPFSVWLPFLPWLFFSALPVPTTVVIGPPLEPTQPGPDGDWESLTEELRQHCQKQLNTARATYECGMKWRELFLTWWHAPEPFWHYLPLYWPWRFLAHARRHAAHLFPDAPPPWWFWLPIIGWNTPPAAFNPQTASATTEQVELGLSAV